MTESISYKNMENFIRIILDQYVCQNNKVGVEFDLKP